MTIRCSHCKRPAAHFTDVDGIGYFCDDCVEAGVLPWTRTPDNPGINPLASKGEFTLRVILSPPGHA